MTIGRWVPVVIWGCVILAATSLPAASVPRGPAGLDKAGHFTMYAVLGLLAWRAAAADAAPRLRVAAATLGAIGVFAAVDEWHQGFVPGRMPDAADWAADMVGAVAGIGAIAFFTLRRSARS